MKKKQASPSRANVPSSHQVKLYHPSSRQLCLEERTAKSYAFALAKQGAAVPKDKETS